MKLHALSVTLSLSELALLSALLIVDAKATNDLAVVAAITKIETDTVQADLANDRPFFEKLLADDWTFGDSGGSWLAKPELLIPRQLRKDQRLEGSCLWRCSGCHV